MVWVHAAPSVLDVLVRDGKQALVARGSMLKRAGDQLPMTRLSIRDDAVEREDRWPNDNDLGAVVVLHGGEAGLLRSWWNAGDGSSWRWQLEFYNHR